MNFLDQIFGTPPAEAPRRKSKSKASQLKRIEAHRRMMSPNDELTRADLEILYPGMPLLQDGIWENVLNARGERLIFESRLLALGYPTRNEEGVLAPVANRAIANLCRLVPRDDSEEMAAKQWRWAEQEVG